MKKRLTALALLLALVLAGCSTTQQQINTYNATLYVQGFLDETYTGAPSEGYLKLTEGTAEDAQKTFEQNVEAEYRQRLALRFELEPASVPLDLEEDFLDLLRQVYAKTSYSVRAAVPLDDKRYCVEVAVSPVTFFAAAYSDGFAQLKKDFQKAHPEPTEEDLEDLSPAQAKKRVERYESAWAQEVYDYLYLRKDAITNGAAVVKLLLVSPNSNGLYTVSQTDRQDLDDVILQY